MLKSFDASLPAVRRLVLSMAPRALPWRALSCVTPWLSGWNIDRQKHDYEDHDRIERDFRNVETPTPPLLHSLLVHGRSPSVVNRPIITRSAYHRTAGQVLGEVLKCSESGWRRSTELIQRISTPRRCTAGFQFRCDTPANRGILSAVRFGMRWRRTDWLGPQDSNLCISIRKWSGAHLVGKSLG